MIFGYLAVLGAVAGFSWYLYYHGEELHFFQSLAAWQVWTAALFILVGYFLNAYQLHLFLKHFGLVLGLFEILALTFSMILGNYLIPMRGGSGALAVYLKAVHRLDFKAFAAIYAGTALLITLINSGLALVCLCIAGLTGWSVNILLVGVVTGMFSVCLYFAVAPPGLNPDSRLPGLISGVVNSWHLLAKDRALVLRLVLSFLETACVLMLAFYFAYDALGASISALGVLVVSSLGTVANLVPFTPGSAGFFEAVTIQIPQLFGVDMTRSVAAAAIFRLVSLCWAFLLGIPGILYLIHRKKTAGRNDS